jgi:Phage integrase family
VPRGDARRPWQDSSGVGRPAADTWQDWDLLWCRPDGRPIDAHDDWEEWKTLVAEAGITKNARLHDARHICGTLLGEQHVDMHVIQRILGHAQVSTTRIYAAPTDPLTREAVDRLGSMLWPEPEGNRNRNRNQRSRAKRGAAGNRRST